MGPFPAAVPRRPFLAAVPRGIPWGRWLKTGKVVVAWHLKCKIGELFWLVNQWPLPLIVGVADHSPFVEKLTLLRYGPWFNNYGYNLVHQWRVKNLEFQGKVGQEWRKAQCEKCLPSLKQPVYTTETLRWENRVNTSGIHDQGFEM